MCINPQSLAQSVGRTHQFIVFTDGTLGQDAERDGGDGEDKVGVIELWHVRLVTNENPYAYDRSDECYDDNEGEKATELHLLFTVLKYCYRPTCNQGDKH